MKIRNTLKVLATALLITAGTMAGASDRTELEIAAEEAELQRQLEAEYKQALSEANEQRRAAALAAEKAREQLKRASEQRDAASKQSAEARAQREAEMMVMREELSTTHRQLQETTREIARVNREIARATADHHSSKWVVRTSETPVIGVILGNANDRGVEILGVSPDGPSDRAGLEKGDVIIAVGGRALTAIEDARDARAGLRIAMQDIEVDEPLVVSVEREDKVLELTVVPEVREPLSWQSVTRFPTAPRAPRAVTPSSSPEAPHAPGKVVTIERIVVPEIDTVQMTEQIEQMRVQIEKRRAAREDNRVSSDDDVWEYEFYEMSELGDFALQDANIWFGFSMTQGLQLAEIDPGLGEYFKTDRGVLVLKARDDNDLQLKSGDVVLQVGDIEVNSPAEFMRALRSLHSGDELVMDIKRGRKDHTLKMVMPDKQTSFILPNEDNSYTFTITSSR